MVPESITFIEVCTESLRIFVYKKGFFSVVPVQYENLLDPITDVFVVAASCFFANFL